MDIPVSALWWAATALVIVAELATGTFYLLMIALGTACAAIAVHLGAGGSLPLVVAAVVGCSATVLWHWRRVQRPGDPAPMEDRSINLDIGERVHVPAWLTDRSARVNYRGTTWAARLQPGAPLTSGDHIVRAIEGNWLVLAPLGDAAQPGEAPTAPT